MTILWQQASTTGYKTPFDSFGSVVRVFSPATFKNMKEMVQGDRTVHIWFYIQRMVWPDS